MSAVTRKTDGKGRLLLFSDFADQLVVVERLGDDEVRIRKGKAARARPSLKQLLAGVTDENRHPEISTGPSVGKEAW